MRTTIRIDDRLLKEAKSFALNTGRTLTAVVEGALRESLLRKKGPRKIEPIELCSSGEEGLRPGVDLDHSAELLERMES